MPISKGYSRTQILLHWAVAVLIIPQFLFNDAIGEAFDAGLEGTAVPFNAAAPLHILTGLLICAAVIWRVVLRITHGAPAPVSDPKAPMTKVAKGVHHLLYVVLTLIVVSGATAKFGGIEAAGDAHGILTTVLLVLLALHVAGALKQQFVEKTNVIARMMKAE
ncbi:cytochrome b561 [Rhodobacter viridis]|uniref:Cytochrome b561 n=1 Tax=Rhodobacter viridis TaxID=1054202 RepID=A0A318U095_9RHOB|nr:cytochrome b/b6 domain-containing protein [Rhodobacter viridis]PYF11111.1 cytochrome b561 [Rhodobacter viridis]